MMCDTWRDRLSEYLDGDLAEGEHVELEAHFADCAECRDTIDQLRAVVAKAGALENRLPTSDLWSGVAERIGTHRSPEPGVVAIGERQARRRGRISVSIPQLAAAGIALVMISAATTLLLRPQATPFELPQASAITQAATAEAVLVAFDVAEYDAAVAELERVLRQARERLDRSTVEVLEQSLATIDRAIEEAQQALRDDPANRYLSAHLAATMKRKIQLLRRATTIASAAS
jgi:anti-sigma factor RsiW